jgi:hypothetical protein
MSTYTFQVNKQYKRSEILEANGLDPRTKGGPWYTGYAERNGLDFIFSNVGAAARTEHDYDNYFDGVDLVWRGKTTSHVGQRTIRRMTSSGAEVHIFWRTDDREPFTYAGLGNAVGVEDVKPVKIRWQFANEQGQRKDSRSAERLPAEAFSKIGADHVLEAVQMLLGVYVDHAFGPSTDYDLVAMDDQRLPPKAVFGLAAKLALGFEILPKHFSAGDTSTCFRILRQAGYQVVPKGQQVEIIPPLSESDQEWAEGKPKLVTHLVRERAKGLAPAKRTQSKRDHGKLFCERCKLDPVEIYGSVYGEACIEVHHQDVHVSDMKSDHKTGLASLQCLCANCHRFVHRRLKEQIARDKLSSLQSSSI